MTFLHLSQALNSLAADTQHDNYKIYETECLLIYVEVENFRYVLMPYTHKSIIKFTLGYYDVPMDLHFHNTVTLLPAFYFNALLTHRSTIILILKEYNFLAKELVNWKMHRFSAG